jgi:hypothetical protein
MRNNLPPPSSQPDEMDWSKLAREHFVQWYDQEKTLTQFVGSFFTQGLKEGNGAIIIATPEHRSAVDDYIRQRDLDISSLIGNGRYVSLDARETLEKFMVRGVPNRQKFFEVIGPVVSGSVNRWDGLWAFGEMVALLWDDGNTSGAVELEMLWNNLAKIYPFTLFCAYPKRTFASTDEERAFQHVCSAHSTCLVDKSTPD